MAVEIIVPIMGVNEGVPVDKTDPATSGHMNNCRPQDVLENRLRLGQRPGLDKWGAGTQVGAGEQPVVAMIFVDVAE